MRNPRVSAWARSFIADNWEQEQPVSAATMIRASQEAARADLERHNRKAIVYARIFVWSFILAVIPWPPSLVREIAFVVAIIAGSIAISTNEKAARCRMELAVNPEEFL